MKENDAKQMSPETSEESQGTQTDYLAAISVVIVTHRQLARRGVQGNGFPWNLLESHGNGDVQQNRNRNTVSWE
jgi:hypothetical protein